MVRLLLDFPWSFEVILDPDPGPLELAQAFIIFCREVGLKPAPFVDHEEVALFMQKLNVAPGKLVRRGTWVSDAMRFLDLAGCGELGTFRAHPIDGPGDLRSKWERALRDQIGDGSNWRKCLVPTVWT